MSQSTDDQWWREAVVYQCYIRSFADGNGDGIGDIAGLRARIPHLVDLGVDAVWINPWYPSPQHDAGYDVADYRDIEPSYGTLAEADELLAALKAAGLRVFLDIVPNHTSDDHPWFQAALGGDEAARARYIFRPGAGDGSLPPNNWQSSFGGPAWSRLPNGEWYLHLFAPEQPDVDWTNPEVVAEFEDVLRFWFDRGVDGFRIDVAHGLAKTPGLPDADEHGLVSHNAPHPAWDHDAVHEIYRRWRRVADSYYPPRIFVAEAWVADSARLGHYLRPDELHTAFQFDFMRAPFRAPVMRAIVEESLAQSAELDTPSTWVLSNHDVVRQVTRFSRPQADGMREAVQDRQRFAVEAPDNALGERRARAAILAVLALPGTAYLYQGEELGLAEFEQLPDERRQDPVFVQTAGADPGRDGCRVPLPWSGDAAPYGFGDVTPDRTWLPQPDDWAPFTAEAQDGDPASTLELYRRALRLRRERLVGQPDFAWVEAGDDVLAFRRGGVECWVNTGTSAVALPEHELLVASDPGVGAELPADTGAWFVRR
ncbi:glycoside hydrolase family 13 protein [Nocardioides currus]|uniref:Alpha-glucosidase n=1 Tax=Nocardioides currus TaxID=2133958 RepID=A0A2R7Z1U7_9ACTN|nr:glycoside hydrolase family 13 protein [Nocardioides currus]PUA82226.1 alpha-glucosidase [Nocardioides currus]